MSQTITNDQSAPAATADTVPRTDNNRWGAPRCGYRINAFMLWLATRVLWLGYGLVWLAALWFFLIHARARNASIHYLDLLHSTTTSNRRRNALTRGWQTYRHMVSFGILLLDRALMLARPTHGFAIDCEGLEHLRAAVDSADNRGVLLLSAHFGMAEIAAPYMRRMGMNRPANIVMYQNAADGTEQFHSRHRHMLQHVNVISTTDPLAAGIKIIAALKKGEVVAMRADRTLAGKTVEATLLGERILLPAGPFLAAALSGARVLHIYTCRLAYRRYRCLILPGKTYDDDTLPRDQRIVQAAQDFATLLESTLRRFPWPWSNFYDLWQVQAAGASNHPSSETSASSKTSV
jgi:KDO2-lipid IV(A) lauroyltransferase